MVEAYPRNYISALPIGGADDTVSFSGGAQDDNKHSLMAQFGDGTQSEGGTA
ncbi:MAG: hypothetical protein RIC52_05965 [Amphiplicatus sp.]